MDDIKSIVRKTLSLNGLRTNAEPVPSPNRKSALLVRPVHGEKKHPRFNTQKILPESPFLIHQNGSENASRLRAKIAFPPKSDRLYEWITLQQTYIESLTFRDFNVLISYTYLGDMLVNNFIRGTLHDLTDLFSDDVSVAHLSFLGFYLFDNYDTLSHTLNLPHRSKIAFTEPVAFVNDMLMPITFVEIVKLNFEFFINPDNIAPFLDAYQQDLTRIIQSAPRLLSPLTVYRGFKSETHLRGLEFINPDFVSTSLSVSKAIDFSSLPHAFYTGRMVPPVEYYGGVYEITIHSDIPCIYMHLFSKIENEFEVLLPPGLHFTYDSKIHYKKYPAEVELAERRIAIIHAKVRNPTGGRRTRKTTRRRH